MVTCRTQDLLNIENKENAVNKQQIRYHVQKAKKLIIFVKG